MGKRPSFAGLANIQSSSKENWVVCFQAFNTSSMSGSMDTFCSDSLVFTSPTRCLTIHREICSVPANQFTFFHLRARVSLILSRRTRGLGQRADNALQLMQESVKLLYRETVRFLFPFRCSTDLHATHRVRSQRHDLCPHCKFPES
jgi:hypothetical protein